MSHQMSEQQFINNFSALSGSRETPSELGPLFSLNNDTKIHDDLQISSFSRSQPASKTPQHQLSISFLQNSNFLGSPIQQSLETREKHDQSVDKRLAQMHCQIRVRPLTSSKQQQRQSLNRTHSSLANLKQVNGSKASSNLLQRRSSEQSRKQYKDTAEESSLKQLVRNNSSQHQQNHRRLKSAKSHVQQPGVICPESLVYMLKKIKRITSPDRQMQSESKSRRHLKSKTAKKQRHHTEADSINLTKMGSRLNKLKMREVSMQRQSCTPLVQSRKIERQTMTSMSTTQNNASSQVSHVHQEAPLEGVMTTQQALAYLTEEREMLLAALRAKSNFRLSEDPVPGFYSEHIHNLVINAQSAFGVHEARPVSTQNNLKYDSLRIALGTQPLTTVTRLSSCLQSAGNTSDSPRAKVQTGQANEGQNRNQPAGSVRKLTLKKSTTRRLSSTQINRLQSSEQVQPCIDQAEIVVEAPPPIPNISLTPEVAAQTSEGKIEALKQRLKEARMKRALPGGDPQTAKFAFRADVSNEVTLVVQNPNQVDSEAKKEQDPATHEGKGEEELRKAVKRVKFENKPPRRIRRRKSDPCFLHSQRLVEKQVKSHHSIDLIGRSPLAFDIKDSTPPKQASMFNPARKLQVSATQVSPVIEQKLGSVFSFSQRRKTHNEDAGARKLSNLLAGDIAAEKTGKREYNNIGWLVKENMEDDQSESSSDSSQNYGYWIFKNQPRKEAEAPRKTRLLQSANWTSQFSPSTSAPGENLLKSVIDAQLQSVKAEMLQGRTHVKPFKDQHEKKADFFISAPAEEPGHRDSNFDKFKLQTCRSEAKEKMLQFGQTKSATLRRKLTRSESFITQVEVFNEVVEEFDLFCGKRHRYLAMQSSEEHVDKVVVSYIMAVRKRLQTKMKRYKRIKKAKFPEKLAIEVKDLNFKHIEIQKQPKNISWQIQAEQVNLSSPRQIDFEAGEIFQTLERKYLGSIHNYSFCSKQTLKQERIEASNIKIDAFMMFQDISWKSKNEERLFIFLEDLSVLKQVTQSPVLASIKALTELNGVYECFDWACIEKFKTKFETKCLINQKLCCPRRDFKTSLYRNSIVFSNPEIKNWNLPPDSICLDSARQYKRVDLGLFPGLLLLYRRMSRLTPIVVRYKCGRLSSKIYKCKVMKKFDEPFNHLIEVKHPFYIHNEDHANLVNEILKWQDKRAQPESFKKFYARHVIQQEDHIFQLLFNQTNQSLYLRLHERIKNKVIFYEQLEHMLNLTQNVEQINNRLTILKRRDITKYVSKDELANVDSRPRKCSSLKHGIDFNSYAKLKQLHTYMFQNNSDLVVLKRKFQLSTFMSMRKFIQEKQPDAITMVDGEGGAVVQQFRPYCRHDALNHFNREYRDFIISKHLQNLSHKIKDSLNLFYSRVEQVKPSSDQEFFQIINYFGFKCQLARDPDSKLNTIYEIYTPTPIEQATQKVKDYEEFMRDRKEVKAMKLMQNTLNLDEVNSPRSQLDCDGCKKFGSKNFTHQVIDNFILKDGIETDEDMDEYGLSDFDSDKSDGQRSTRNKQKIISSCHAYQHYLKTQESRAKAELKRKEKKLYRVVTEMQVITQLEQINMLAKENNVHLHQIIGHTQADVGRDGAEAITLQGKEFAYQRKVEKACEEEEQIEISEISSESSCQKGYSFQNNNQQAQLNFLDRPPSSPSNLNDKNNQKQDELWTIIESRRSSIAILEPINNKSNGESEFSESQTSAQPSIAPLDRENLHMSVGKPSSLLLNVFSDLELPTRIKEPNSANKIKKMKKISTYGDLNGMLNFNKGGGRQRSASLFQGFQNNRPIFIAEQRFSLVRQRGVHTVDYNDDFKLGNELELIARYSLKKGTLLNSPQKFLKIKKETLKSVIQTINEKRQAEKNAFQNDFIIRQQLERLQYPTEKMNESQKLMFEAKKKVAEKIDYLRNKAGLTFEPPDLLKPRPKDFTNRKHAEQDTISSRRKIMPQLQQFSRANERLREAVIHQRHKIVQEIMDRFQIDFETTDENGNNLVIIATMQKDLEMVKILALRQVNLNHQNNDGNTSLHFACSSGELKITNYLLSRGAREDLENSDGLTCWQMMGGIK